MAYSEELADRVRDVLAGRQDVSERRMFGGLCVMVGGHMACGIVRDDLMLRLGAEGAERALAKPHVREMDFTGKPLTGMVYVAAEGVKDARSLRRWVGEAVAFAEALPPKTPKRPPA